MSKSAVRSEAFGSAMKFSALGVPSLLQGRADHVVTNTGDLSVVVKVYASGGENATHAHRTEDHVFFVLGGKAKFHLGRGGEDVVVVEKFDGIYLPQESYYRFTSVGEENLVMLRVGSLVRAQAKGLSGPERIDAEGKVFPGDSLLNGPYMERREEPGVRFEG